MIEFYLLLKNGTKFSCLFVDDPDSVYRNLRTVGTYLARAKCNQNFVEFTTDDGLLLILDPSNVDYVYTAIEED